VFQASRGAISEHGRMESESATSGAQQDPIETFDFVPGDSTTGERGRYRERNSTEREETMINDTNKQTSS
jgi:hypothetical protein